jgi:radical SAM protein with 4Fe4S-binding SPASM domain
LAEEGELVSKSSAGNEREALVVMARRPLAGAVKTRLAAAVGEEAALVAYRRLLADVMTRAQEVDDTELVLALPPQEEEEAGADSTDDLMRALGVGEIGNSARGGRWNVLPQHGADLGERLANVLGDLFTDGASAAVAVNSDSPGLPSEYLAQALSALRRDGMGSSQPAVDRLVIGPALDGGYYAIGTDRATWLRREKDIRALLGTTPMGTSSALAHTLAAAERRGLEAEILPLWVDVDEAADLVWLERLRPPFDDGSPAPSRGEPLSGLREITLHVTHRCGLSCRHCYNAANPRERGELSTDEWRGVIDQAVTLGAESFVFIGGDPFLRADLPDLLDHVTGVHGRKARLFFNSLVDEDRARELARVGHGLMRPLVSVDGTREVNDSLRRPGNFDDALTSVHNLIAAGLKPVANTVTLTPVLPVLPEMTRIIRRAGITRLHLILPHHRGAVTGSTDLVPSGEEMLRAMRALYETAREIDLFVDNVPAWKRRLKAPQDFCAAGCKDLAVDPYGKLYACPITCGDPAFVAGDLRSRDLESIWRTSPAFRLLRHAHARDRLECSGCPVVDACGGECWMQAHYRARMLEEPAGFGAPFPYCDLVRPMFEEIVAAAIEAGEHSALAKAPVCGGGAEGGCGGQAMAGKADYALFDCI